MKVYGYNPDSRLSGSISNKAGMCGLHSPCQSSLKASQILSFSSYFTSVWVTQSGEAFVFDDNKSWRISSTLPKEEFETDTKINIQNKNSQPCKFISAVREDYTLYQVSGGKNGDPSQLIYACYKMWTIFLKIGKRSPLALFGGDSTSVVIDTEDQFIIRPLLSLKHSICKMAIEQSKLHVAVKLSLCLAKVGYSSNIHLKQQTGH